MKAPTGSVLNFVLTVSSWESRTLQLLKVWINDSNFTKLLRSTTLHQPEWPLSKCPQTINAGEGVEKREPHYTVGGDVIWCNQCGKEHGDSSENYRQSYRLI